MTRFLSFLLLAPIALLSADAAAPVVTAAVERGNIRPSETFVGSLRYATLSKLAAQSAAALETIAVDAGDRVKAGQILAVQESAILSANIAAKTAELKKSKASDEQARKDAERYKALLKQNSVSEQTYEQFRLKAVELAAQSETLAAQLKALEIEKAQRSIRAPFDGVVVERHASVGDYLNAGASAISLAKTDSIELAVYLPASTIGRLDVGTPVGVIVSGERYAAKIAGVSPRGDAESRLFLTRVAFDKPNQKLLEGMEAALSVAGEASENALLISRDAVVSRLGGNVVFYVENGVAQSANVEILGYDGQNAALRSITLKEGMQAIVKGNERIAPNQPVRSQ
ncbi:MAG: efflux RND transporter periplasmic adaptor subunit [Helicobacteraceae bacterium]|jgi:RND family efflux transporter MFP subunit|nr:efflux RND transporter periplasmic adaptor subunit [Helicobacteraceae bacterium]